MSAPGTTQRATSTVDLIRRKRDGERLSPQDIAGLIDDYVNDRVPDYQMAAWLMASLLNGLDEEESTALTRAMVDSGDTVDLAPLGRRIVDKHSTGGVGDKVSLVLAPLVAACDVPFAKMSGRGLGHTGGTLDKLESIPGFRVELTQQQFLQQVQQVGVAIVGQTADIVPADKRLYALRDVTATVESIPLIAASVMSKKIACGADAILLDVKVGSGAFMKDLETARELADRMIEIGQGAGRQVQVLLTDMSKPLGRAVGNALEIAEVQAVLRGEGPADLSELALTAAAVLLSMSDLEVSEEEGRALAEQALSTGAAVERFERWVAAQGGRLQEGLPAAPIQHTVLAASSGVLTHMDALTVGQVACRLGAGRLTKEDVIDHAVGIELHAGVGEFVGAGSPLLTVHARREEEAYLAADQIEAVTRVDPRRSTPPGSSIVLERRP